MKFAKFQILVLAASVALASAALPTKAQDQGQPAPLVPKFARGNASDIITADIFDTIVYLPVNIGGKGPYSFILDTGNGGAPVVNENLARTLGIALGTKVPITGGAGSAPVDLYPIDTLDLSVPGLAFSGVPAATLPLDLMDPHWGKHKDGLLGGTIFSVAITDIDYARRTVRFSDPKAFTPPAGEVIPIEVYGQPFVRARVYLYGAAQPVEALLMVDTGVRVTTFNSPFSRTNKLVEQSPKTLATMSGFGINGASWGTVGRIQAIELGPVRLENPVVTFSTDKAGALSSDQFSGILGADILKRFHVVFDYPGGRMFLEKNADFGSPFEFDMSGLRLVAEGKDFGTVKVFHVADKTPAQAAGLKAGDEIRTIDGRSASTFNWETLRAYLQRPGQTVKLEVVRDGKTIPVALTLQRLV